MLTALIKLARPTQWLKNGVVFAGLIFAGEAEHLLQIEMAVLAAAVFCAIAGADIISEIS